MRALDKDLNILDDHSLTTKEVEKIYHEHDSEQIAKKVFLHPGISFFLFRKLLPFFTPNEDKNPNYDKWYDTHLHNDYECYAVDFSFFGAECPQKTWPYKVIYKGNTHVSSTSFVNSAYARENFSGQELEDWVRKRRWFEPEDLLGLPDTPEDKLLEAIDAKNFEAMIRIAPKPDLSPAIFERLAKHRNWQVRIKVAENHGASVTILKKLSNDRKSEVAASAKKNPNFQQKNPQIAKFSLSLEGNNRQETLDIIRDTQLVDSVVDELYQSAVTDIDRFFIALQQNPTDKIIVDGLSRPGWVKAALAYNQKTAMETLSILADEKHKDVQRALAQNPNLPVKESLALLQSKDPATQRYLLATTRHEEVLNIVRKEQPSLDNIKGIYALLLDPGSKTGLVSKPVSQGKFRHFTDISRRVAQHPNCSKKRYEKLFTFFPKEIENNPSYKLYLLERAKKLKPKLYTKDKFVTRAKSGWASEYECDVFFDDDDLAISREIASVSWFSPFKLQKWIFHHDLTLRKRLASRSDLTSFMAKALASDPKPGVRNIILKNKSVKSNKSDIVEAKDFLVDRYQPTPKNIDTDALKPSQLAKLMDRGEEEFIEKYKSHKSIVVRRAVASAFYARKGTLLELCQESDTQILINASCNLFHQYKLPFEQSLGSNNLKTIFRVIEPYFEEKNPDFKKTHEHFIYLLIENVSDKNVLDILKKRCLECLQGYANRKPFSGNTVNWFPLREFERNEHLDDQFKLEAIRIHPALTYHEFSIESMSLEIFREILLLAIPVVPPNSIGSYIKKHSQFAKQLKDEDWRELIASTEEQSMQEKLNEIGRAILSES